MKIHTFSWSFTDEISFPAIMPIEDDPLLVICWCALQNWGIDMTNMLWL